MILRAHGKPGHLRTAYFPGGRACSGLALTFPRSVSQPGGGGRQGTRRERLAAFASAIPAPAEGPLQRIIPASGASPLHRDEYDPPRRPHREHRRHRTVSPDDGSAPRNCPTDRPVRAPTDKTDSASFLRLRRASAKRFITSFHSRGCSACALQQLVQGRVRHVRPGHLQTGGRITGMHCGADDLAAGHLQASRQFEGEHQVGRLALRIGRPLGMALLPTEIIEPDAPHQVSETADCHDTCTAGSFRELQNIGSSWTG